MVRHIILKFVSIHDYANGFIFSALFPLNVNPFYFAAGWKETKNVGRENVIRRTSSSPDHIPHLEINEKNWVFGRQNCDFRFRI